MRSVSELAKLVTSGRIRVPKSLVHYVDDRAQLLDQIFTILSPSDVKGMLPDILKVWRHAQNMTMYWNHFMFVCVHYTGSEDEAGETTLL